jgi:N-acyl-D-amino-acid deacylase
MQFTGVRRRISYSRLVLAAFVVMVCAPLDAFSQTPPQFDVILRGGTVVDGTGSRPFVADVGIVGDRILGLGDLSDAVGDTDLDVRGLLVAPGFINIHSHAVPKGLPKAENMLTQGVTTEIINADGQSATDIRQQLAVLARDGLAVNLGAYAGFNTVWARVVGYEDRRPSREELLEVRQLIVDNLERGAWGVSAGLDYSPARLARTDEVIQALSDLTRWRTNFTNHDRVTPESGYSSIAGMLETLQIGYSVGMVPVITHMKVQGHEQGSADGILSQMTDAVAAGRYTAADVYPYLAGLTGLHALIVPAWAQEGGFTRMLERFGDPDMRRRIVLEADATIEARFGAPSSVYLPESGRNLVDVMGEIGTTSGGEAVVHVLEEEGWQAAILRFGSEADLVKILRSPTASVSCDCGASPDAAHPRYFGTYPRVLGRYVREQGVLTWEEAVRKMTALPAATIGLVDRGYLAVGMSADVVVFDSATVMDYATFESPELPSVGIRHVFVNGRTALSEGAPTGEQGGSAIFRDMSMPSRPMNLDHERSISVVGPGRFAFELEDSTYSPVEIEFEVAQSPGSREASGLFRFSAPGGGIDFEASQFGILQTADGWASFTGVVRGRGRERALLVIVDASDSRLNGATTVTVEIEGIRKARLVIPSGNLVLLP